MALKRLTNTKTLQAAAMYLRIAAAFLFCAWVATPGGVNAQDSGPRILASELLIMGGDLARLDDPALSSQHLQGLSERLSGALGLVPWLLKQAGDPQGADVLTTWQGAQLDTDKQKTSLATLLAALSRRHALDLPAFDQPLTATSIREARAIHETYCAGCHDEAGNGDPEQPLPARDLFLMARQEVPEIFLARLLNGIKGDATLGFRNPMTDKQLSALWKYYLSH